MLQLATEAQKNRNSLGKLPPQLLKVVGALLQNREKTLAWLRAAQDEHPADFSINYNLAVELTKSTDTAGLAIEFCRAAIALRPTSPSVYNLLGNAYYQQGKLDEAVAAWNTAVKHNEQYAWAWYNLGKHWHQQKELDAAVDAFDKALKDSCTKRESEFSPIWNSFGLLLRDKGEFAKASEKFIQAHRLGERIPGWESKQFRYKAACVNEGKAKEVVQAIKILRDWQADRDLTGVRDLIDKLPENEQQAWCDLWKKVRELFELASKGTKGT